MVWGGGCKIREDGRDEVFCGEVGRMRGGCGGDDGREGFGEWFAYGL